MCIWTYIEFQVGERQGGLPADDTLFVDLSHHYTILQVLFYLNICGRVCSFSLTYVSYLGY